MLGHQTVSAARPIARRHATDGLGTKLITAPIGRTRTTVAISFKQSIVTQLALAMMLTVLAMVLYLQQAAQVSVHEFNISDLQAQQSQLALTNIDLHARMTNLSAVPRITSLATAQLHMGHPDPLTALWVRPVVPDVAPPPTASGDSATALRQSEPLHWMTTTLTWVKAQL